MSSNSLYDEAALLVTVPAYEYPHAANPTDLQTRCWLGAFVRYRSPWYLLAWKPGASSPIETVIVAWASILLQLLRQLDDDKLVSVHVLAPHESAGWEMLAVSEVWEPATQEPTDTGPVILRVPGRGLIDCALGPVVDNAGRKLVARPRCAMKLPLGLEPR
jgi:hypothetical protein